MPTRPITIQVDSAAADAFDAASADQRRKLEVLLSLRLTEITQTQESLAQVMDEIGRTAHDRGMTPELLQTLLDES